MACWLGMLCCGSKTQSINETNPYQMSEELGLTKMMTMMKGEQGVSDMGEGRRYS